MTSLNALEILPQADSGFVKLNIKSMAIGAVVVVLAMLVIGATDLSTNPIGRYQIAGASGFFVILDTANGQAWWANAATPGLISEARVLAIIAENNPA